MTAEQPPQASPSTLLRGGVLLGISSLAVTAITIVVTRIYAQRYGAVELSAMLLFRLYATTMFAFAALGMPIALQRTVAFLHDDERAAQSTAVVGLAIGTVSVGLVCALTAAFAPGIASALDHPAASTLWMAYMLLTWTQAIGTMVALVELGRGRIRSAAAVNVLSYGVALLLPLLVQRQASLATVTFEAAVLALLFAIPMLASTLRWGLRRKLFQPMERARALFRYGLPRTIASALEPLSDLALPWLALLSGAGLLGAGRLAIGLALLRPLNPLTNTLNQLLIPDAARLAANGDMLGQRRRVESLLEFSFDVGWFATVQLVIWTDVLVALWLGAEYVSAATVARVVCLCLTPTLVYSTIRGVVDGSEERAINTRNTLISVAVMVAVSAVVGFFRLGPISLALAFLCSRVVLGGLTVHYVFSTHGARTEVFGFSFVLSLLFGMIAAGLRFVTAAQWHIWVCVPVVALLGLAYLYAVGKRGTLWAHLLLERARLA